VPALKDHVAKLFGDWQGEPAPAIETTQAPGGTTHLTKETTQTQITLAYPSVPYRPSRYYAAQGAVQVSLGRHGGPALHRGPRERGVAIPSTRVTRRQDRARFIGYAGTTNERAQETLDVTLAEIKRLQDGVEQDEVNRVKAGLKSSVIMQEERLGSRGRDRVDWYYLGRVRSTEEIQAAIDSLSPTSIVDHVRRYPPKDLTLVTLARRRSRLSRPG